MPAVYPYSVQILLQLHIGVQVFVGMMLICLASQPQAMWWMIAGLLRLVKL